MPVPDEQPKIMVVDDTVANLKLLEEMLIQQGYRVRAFPRGRLALAAAARERGCFRLYWLTQENNATARRLYDRVAKYTGFIRYDFTL